MNNISKISKTCRPKQIVEKEIEVLILFHILFSFLLLYWIFDWFYFVSFYFDYYYYYCDYYYFDFCFTYFEAVGIPIDDIFKKRGGFVSFFDQCFFWNLSLLFQSFFDPKENRESKILAKKRTLGFFSCRLTPGTWRVLFFCFFIFCFLWFNF